MLIRICFIAYVFFASAANAQAQTDEETLVSDIAALFDQLYGEYALDFGLRTLTGEELQFYQIYNVHFRNERIRINAEIEEKLLELFGSSASREMDIEGILGALGHDEIRAQQSGNARMVSWSLLNFMRSHTTVLQGFDSGSGETFAASVGNIAEDQAVTRADFLSLRRLEGEREAYLLIGEFEEIAEIQYRSSGRYMVPPLFPVKDIVFLAVEIDGSRFVTLGGAFGGSPHLRFEFDTESPYDYGFADNTLTVNGTNIRRQAVHRSLRYNGSRFQ